MLWFEWPGSTNGGKVPCSYLSLLLRRPLTLNPGEAACVHTHTHDSGFPESRAASPQSNLPPGKQQTKVHPVPSRGRISLAFRAVFCSQAAILPKLSGGEMEKKRRD